MAYPVFRLREAVNKKKPSTWSGGWGSATMAVPTSLVYEFSGYNRCFRGVPFSGPKSEIRTVSL